MIDIDLSLERVYSGGEPEGRSDENARKQLETAPAPARRAHPSDGTSIETGLGGVGRILGKLTRLIR